MDTRVQLLSAVAVGAAAFLATAAIAADAPPKEGAFTGKVTVSGELLKTTPVGKNGDSLNVYEENGTTAVGEKVHCFWLVPAIKATPKNYCSTFERLGEML